MPMTYQSAPTRNALMNTATIRTAPRLSFASVVRSSFMASPLEPRALHRHRGLGFERLVEGERLADEEAADGDLARVRELDLHAHEVVALERRLVVVAAR